MLIKAFIKKISSHALARDSAIMFTGSMVSNVFAYIYHLLMGRLLGPVGYGELSSLLSIFYIFSVPLNVGQLVLVKFISGFKAKGEIGQTKSLFIQVTKVAFLVCISALPLIIVLSPAITAYLHIQSLLLFILVYVTFVFSLLTIIMSSVLQGYQKFLWLSILGAGAIICKVLLSIPAVTFGVMGVLIAALVSNVFMYIVTLFPLRFLFAVKPTAIRLTKREAFQFAIPTLLVTLSMTSLYSTDIILVRHYFQAVDAGIYASLAVLGKIIFYATSVLTAIFYPVLSERNAKNEKTGGLIGIGLAAVTLISSCITLCYFLFPEFVIKMLFGSSYVGGSSFLGAFGVFLVLYSIGNMLAVTFLAIGKTKIWIIPVFCALLQIIGISLYHERVMQVIYIDILVSFLLVVGLGGYYLHTKKQNV